MCFPQNSSLFSSMSGPFSGDQPGPGPMSGPPALSALALSSAPSSPELARVAWGLVLGLRKQPLLCLWLFVLPLSPPGSALQDLPLAS